MSFFGGILSALGFESEEDQKTKKKVKKPEPKAKFNLKKDKIERPDKIDGVKVVYIETKIDYDKPLAILKKGEPVLVNFEYADDKSRAMGFFEGAMKMSSDASLSVIEEGKLYILLPEGVEIE